MQDYLCFKEDQIPSRTLEYYGSKIFNVIRATLLWIYLGRSTFITIIKCSCAFTSATIFMQEHFSSGRFENKDIQMKVSLKVLLELYTAI